MKVQTISNQWIKQSILLLLSLLLAVGMMIGFSSVVSATDSGTTDDGFEWEKNDGEDTVTITGYEGNKLEIVIPDKIDDKAVTIIGEEALAYNSLVSVNIPESVTHIGEMAFYENNLTFVDIPNSVTHIGELAFTLNSLESVNIPNGLTRIEYGAFGENNLTSVVIPSSVTHIGQYAFANNNLNKVTIFGVNTTIKDDYVFGKILEEGNAEYEPENLTIRGYLYSTSETYADNLDGVTFEPISEMKVGDTLPVKSDMAVSIYNSENQLIAILVIPEELENGYPLPQANLIVNSTNQHPDGHAIAGEVLDFVFENEYEEKISVEGDFDLTLRVNEGATNPAIHHFTDGVWEYVGGYYSDGFITENVDEFSMYGVFSEKLSIAEAIPKEVTYEVGTKELGDIVNDLNQSPSANAKLSDGSTVELGVEWIGESDPDYDKNKVGEYVFEGYYGSRDDISNPDEIRAEYHVTLYEFTEVELPTPEFTEATCESDEVGHSIAETEGVTYYKVGDFKSGETVRIQAVPDVDLDIELVATDGWEFEEGQYFYEHTFSETDCEPEMTQVELPTPEFTGATCEINEVSYSVTEQEGVTYETYGEFKSGETVTIRAIPGDDVELVATDGWVIDDGHGFFEYTFSEFDESECDEEEPTELTTTTVDGDKILPKTATSTFAFILAGLLLLGVGGGAYFITSSRKKKQTVFKD